MAWQLARDGGMECGQGVNAVLAGCLQRGPVVGSTGGGAVLLEANREVLRGAHTVWLRAEPAELARRIAADPATATQRPPLVGGGPGESADPLERWTFEMERLLQAREPLYAEVASQQIDTGRPQALIHISEHTRPY